MTLWDVDKDSSNRDKPELNHNDQTLQRMAKGTTSMNDVTDTTDTSLIASIFAGILQPIQNGSTTLVSPNSPGTSTNIPITHNLGFKPLILAFVSFSPTGTKYPVPYISPSLTPGSGLIDYQVSMENTDNNTITFYHRDLANSSNVTDYITYYLMRQPVT